MAPKKYTNIKDFYQYYLTEHSDPKNRLLHFVGLAISICLLIYFLANKMFGYIPLAVINAYFFAWIGHFIVEKNRPATFTYPLYSFACDFIMFFDILRGKVSIFK